MSKIAAIVQARMGSTRFPGKVMEYVCGAPMIALLLDRLSLSQEVDLIAVTTPTGPQDDPLTDLIANKGYGVFRGDEEDVLARYWNAGRQLEADVVVRVTGDCPLIDPDVVDSVIRLFLESGVDYACNFSPPSFPHGLDTEVFTMAALDAAHREARVPREREHVTPYIRESGLFSMDNLTSEHSYPTDRWTVDHPEDLVVVTNVFNHFHPRRDFTWQEVIELRDEQPHLFLANRHLIRNANAY